jgi:hypothetical protein
MKRQFTVALVNGTLLLLSGCDNGSNQPAKPEYKIETTEVKLAPSDITITANINLASVQHTVESEYLHVVMPFDISRQTIDHCQKIQINNWGQGQSQCQ